MRSMPWTIARPRNAAPRTFATVSRAEPVERHDVDCGSAGAITLDLYNASALAVPTNPLIIYLPPTGTHLRTTHPSVPPFLFSKYGALASINYRWNIPYPDVTSKASSNLLISHPSCAAHPFPTPLHDTLHAYTYLTDKILPAFCPRPPSPRQGRTIYATQTRSSRDPQRPILIYGSYLGGTLATSLALTESYASRLRSTCIIGVVAKHAIFDWTKIATTKPPPEIQDQPPSEGEIWQHGPWNAGTLHSLKRSLFKKPESCFDSFVSPVLFFHTAGVAPPSTWLSEDSAEDNTTLLKEMEGLTLSDEMGETSPPPSQNATPGKRITEMDIETVRSAHIKFPPRDSGLKIPRSLFLASPSPTSRPETGKKTKSLKAAMSTEITPTAQAEEMARLMRRSIVLHEFKDRVMWDSYVDPHAVSEERVQVKEVRGFDGDGERMEETRVREWIEDSLS